ncbi:MAG: phosphate ABC transporter, permease protein PstA, partial [Actinomycetales bacterium]
MTVVDAPQTQQDVQLHAVPRTFVRSEPPAAEDLDPGSRRVLKAVTAEQSFVQTGAWLASLALTWLIVTRLLPWSGVIAFVLTFFVLGLVMIAVMTALIGGWPEVVDRVMSAVVHGAVILMGVALASTIIFVFVRGWDALPHLNFFTQDMEGVGPRDAFDRGGVLHAIIGSLIQVGIAIVITVPLGIGTAVYMTEIGGRFARIVRTVVEAMTALPSIVAGLFIYTVAIVALGVPSSGLAAALALSVMMLPIITESASA